MTSIAATHTLFEIDTELDALFEDIQEEIERDGQASTELNARFLDFCEAHGEKVDRLGRFVRIMEAREQFCRAEAGRLRDRASAAANNADRTKSKVAYYLLSRDLKKMQGREFTLRVQKNSQDSVRVMDMAALPMRYRKLDLRVTGALWEMILSYLPEELSGALTSALHESRPDVEAIKEALAARQPVSWRRGLPWVARADFVS